MAIHLTSELTEVRRHILNLAAHVEQQVERAVTALLTRDIALARQVRAADDEINELEVDIEKECLRIFALSHPVAGDLRFVMAMLRINTNLERMGDKAKSIAKRTLDLADCQPIVLPDSLVQMCDRSRQMLADVLTALANEDASLCREVRRHDDEVDRLQKQLFEWAHSEIPQHVDATQAIIDILSASRALERIADLSCDIANDVLFLTEGAVVRHRKT